MAVGLGVFLYLGAQSESEKLTIEQIAKEKKNIFVLPKKDQAPPDLRYFKSTPK